jgi:hypothetical protein
MSSTEYPFHLNKREYSRLTKQKSIVNWRAKKDKTRNHNLVIETWAPVRVGTGNMGSGSIGKGYVSGAKTTVPQKYFVEKIVTREIYYDTDKDSYLIKDIEGKFHRAAYPNACRNEKYDCQTREDIDFLLRQCTNLKVW